MSDPRVVLLIVHAVREHAHKVAAEFAKEISDSDILVRVIDADLDALQAAGIGVVEAVPLGPDAARGCELAVVFGGDGTILLGAEVCRLVGTPILGVNLGHVGFLAEADVEDLHQVVQDVIDRAYHVEQRLTLDVEVIVDGTVVERNWALNEVSVEKAARGRMLEVVVEIDDRPLSRWGCDGVVCATPTGSTAYNFSAGGPIVWPDVEALLLVPISAHALFARPIVVSPESKLAIEVVPGATAHGVVSCDARRASALPPGARVEVRRGTTPVRLARLHDASFTDRLVRKFDLPVSGWRGAAEQRQRQDGG